jgi:hypothetical protein
MPKILADPETYTGRSFKNAKGNAECVEFIIKTLNGPSTDYWRPGLKVQQLAPGAPDPIAKGTAIATFVDGKYPANSTGQHAAIYLGQDSQGIQVLDQWRDRPRVMPRTIYWANHGPKLSNQGNAFSVVEW